MINTDYNTLSKKTYELIDNLIQEHKTTLIFTNTRAATERVVHHLKDKYPSHYTDAIDFEDDKDFEISVTTNHSFTQNFKNKITDTLTNKFANPKITNEIQQNNNNTITGIGAHHSSLSKTHRFKIEQGLREGKLKCVVCSTSLELGIDIGYIDLVILLGSPKSVARALQRVGRSGHQLHSITKGRIIVQDRDDLVECSVLLKNAVEKKIDKIHIPKNCLDVLAQQIYGIAITERIHVSDLKKTIQNSYCYETLSDEDFYNTIKYLAGDYAALEDRHVYAKIWYDPDTGMIGRKGKMARVIYMTNIGTIPDSSGVKVKIGAQTIGVIDESFLERLTRGDRFILGGSVYEFQFSRGNVAQVKASIMKRPTVPSWFSEMLPLSFDLANDIGQFKKYVNDKFDTNMSQSDIIKFILDYLYVDEKAAIAIYNYLREQYDFSLISNNKTIVIEFYTDEEKKYAIFHSQFGRRVNDCLSRAIAFAIFKIVKRDIEVGITDNGFYLASKKHIPAPRAISILSSGRLNELLNIAIDKSQILTRRFRHCAGRSLMILRNYKGHQKQVGRQQVSSMILMAAVKRISKDFPILKEAKREVLEDLMDVKNATKILRLIENKAIAIKSVETQIPSPFAFNIVLQSHMDMIRAEDRIEFLKRMHNLVIAKIALEKGKKGIKMNDPSINSYKSSETNNNINDTIINEEWRVADTFDSFDNNKEKWHKQLNELNLPNEIHEAISNLINEVASDEDIDLIKDFVQYLEKENRLNHWPADFLNAIMKTI